MVIDPICGMEIDEATALSAECDGKTNYFCSEHCRKKFLSEHSNEPAEADEVAEQGHACCQHEQHSVKKSVASDPAMATKAGKYACPMCEGVESDHPGDCPKCGMPLERVNPAMKQTRTVYTCPMHPEIEQVGPGDCPICGMDLEPKTVDVSDNGDDEQLTDMTRRFWVGVALSVPLLIIAMGPMVGLAINQWMSNRVFGWLQLILATPVVFWSGWPLLVRGVKSFRSMKKPPFGRPFTPVSLRKDFLSQLMISIDIAKKPFSTSVTTLKTTK